MLFVATFLIGVIIVIGFVYYLNSSSESSPQKGTKTPENKSVAPKKKLTKNIAVHLIKAK